MGKEVSDEFRNEKGWDSNAITPGTPFMDLLAKSLRYWVAKKLNEDPGWANVRHPLIRAEEKQALMRMIFVVFSSK